MTTAIAAFDSAIGAPNFGTPLRDRNNPEHVREDLELYRAGVLDKRSLAEGYRAKANPVELIVKHGPYHPDPAMRGQLKAVRRGHNVRNNFGGMWTQRSLCGIVSGNWPGAATYTANASTANSIGVATTPFVASSAVNAPTTSHNAGQTGVSKGGLVGGIAVCQAKGVYGVILGNTSGTIYVDQWTTIGSLTGAVGTTPGATDTFQVLPFVGPGLWIGLTITALSTANMFTDDTSLAGEITGGNPTGLTRAYVPISAITDPTTAQAASSGQISCSVTFSHTFTAGGTGTANVQGCGLYNGAYLSGASGTPTASTSGAWLLFENALTAANLSGPNGDSAALSWAFTFN